jgi:hypothetical protein
MDIGVYMSKAVLAHKLAARHESNPEQVWNLARWPSALSTPGVHRLFIACDGTWRGYFTLASDAIFNPRDPRAPYGILFDTRSWTTIPPVPAHAFRGFTYDVPGAPSQTPAASGPVESTRIPDR